MSKLLVPEVNYNWAKRLNVAIRSTNMTYSEAANFACDAYRLPIGDAYRLSDWACSL